MDTDATCLDWEIRLLGPLQVVLDGRPLDFGGQRQERLMATLALGAQRTVSFDELIDALNGAVSEPAWRTKPSWYLVTTDDQMIPPPAQRAMSERARAAVTEAPGSHAIYVFQPAVVAQLIRQAASAAS